MADDEWNARVSYERRREGRNVTYIRLSIRQTPNSILLTINISYQLLQHRIWFQEVEWQRTVAFSVVIHWIDSMVLNQAPDGEAILKII
jgi:hypothetical protein